MNLDYPLDELCRESVRCLEQYGLLDGATDQRVAAIPDARTIRYYTSLGLMDRPMTRGRQALYGRRHLLQLLAIKALQIQDLSLAAIQSRLYGASETELLALVEASAASRAPTVPVARTITWHEIPIEPGLKILAVDGWHAATPPAVLLERIQAALTALDSQPAPPAKRAVPSLAKSPSPEGNI
jgi:hypothetical protein